MSVVSDCAGKERFTSYALAEAVVKRRTHQRLRPYHCQNCNGYHVGYQNSMDRKNRNKVRRARQEHIAT